MEPSSLSFFALLGEWAAQVNLVLLVIGICSCIGSAVFIERVLYLKKIDIDTDDLLVALTSCIEQGDLAEAAHRCEESPGAVSSIVRAGIIHHEQERSYVEKAMELRGIVEIAKMERNVRLLSIIAHIAPLIGLLGTVLGFIKAFGVMRVSGLAEVSSLQIAEAMEYALVSTAAGLVLAIPAVLAYNYLVSRIESIATTIQVTAAEVVDMLTNTKKTS